MLEELTSDHIQPPRYKMSNARRRKISNVKSRSKAVIISDAKFSECLRNPDDLLQPVSQVTIDYILYGLLIVTENYKLC